MAQSDKHIGRTTDHYKVQKDRGGAKPDIEQPPTDDLPDVDKDVPADSPWPDERRRQERGNRGPDEQPGFGQGAHARS